MTLDIRRLERAEMAAAARVHRAAFDDRLPWLTGLHTPDDDRAFFTDHVFATCEVWGAWDLMTLTAFIAFRDGWVDHLYVQPSHQGRGLGGGLLQIAKDRYPELRLWTFQRNALARRFYEARGFVVIETTDGSRNDEREPDVLYGWRGTD
jgi:GNAT superfamily N-acetyltransferase